MDSDDGQTTDESQSQNLFEVTPNSERNLTESPAPSPGLSNVNSTRPADSPLPVATGESEIAGQQKFPQFEGGTRNKKNKSIKRFTSGRTKRRKSIKHKIIIEVKV
jgi:hypothetical protein